MGRQTGIVAASRSIDQLRHDYDSLMPPTTDGLTPKRTTVHYTLLVLGFLLAQFLVGFVAAMVTANMGATTIYWRRKLLGILWGATGYLLIAAIAYDVYVYFQH